MQSRARNTFAIQILSVLLCLVTRRAVSIWRLLVFEKLVLITDSVAGVCRRLIYNIP